MKELTRLPATATTDEILNVIAEDGAVILEAVLSADEVAHVKSEIMPYVEATSPGRDNFTGFHTTRTGALVARSPACRRLVMHDAVLAAARKFLEPYCARIQLHLTQVIRIRPGQEAQPIHRDRWAWGTHLKDVEPQFNTIWAVTRFTTDNGATRVVPGSVDWPDDRKAKEDEIVQAVMEPGSVILYTGSVFHGGGANTSDEDRIGINLTYSLAWLRQEENQYLSCPPAIAKDLEPELQALVGYAIGSYALGYYTPPLAPGEGPELVGPEHALHPQTDSGDNTYSQFGATELFEKIVADTAGEP